MGTRSSRRHLSSGAGTHGDISHLRWSSRLHRAFSLMAAREHLIYDKLVRLPVGLAFHGLPPEQPASAISWIDFLVRKALRPPEASRALTASTISLHHLASTSLVALRLVDSSRFPCEDSRWHLLGSLVSIEGPSAPWSLSCLGFLIVPFPHPHPQTPPSSTLIVVVQLKSQFSKLKSRFAQLKSPLVQLAVFSIALFKSQYSPLKSQFAELKSQHSELKSQFA